MLRSSLSRLAHLSLSLAWLSPSLFPPIVTIKVLFRMENEYKQNIKKSWGEGTFQGLFNPIPQIE